MLIIGDVLPLFGPFHGHVVQGAAYIETQEVGHNWTIAAGEKSVKKFLLIYYWDTRKRDVLCPPSSDIVKA